MQQKFGIRTNPICNGWFIVENFPAWPHHKKPSTTGWPQNRMGVEFEGTEGKVFIWRNEVEAEPKSLLRVQIGGKDKVRLRADLPGDFIDCVLRGRPTCAPVHFAHHSTTICSIAAIAMQLGRKLTWDMAREQFVNDDQSQPPPQPPHARGLGCVMSGGPAILEC